MTRLKIVTIGILLLIADRVEFLYYGIENPSEMVGFVYSGAPIRIDSYIYFASIRIQQLIFAIILNMLLPEFRKETTAFVIVSFLYFMEFFWSYNEPTTTIRITEYIYIPISVAALKLMVIFGIIVSVINKYT